MNATAYYRAALVALAHVERRTPTGRRFGPEADARWSSFRGDLTTADRIDLLLRDADAQWPSAFGARTVFAQTLFGQAAVAEDEAFGPEWRSLDPVEAEELWREVTRADAPASVRDTLEAAATTWELDLVPFELAPFGAADRLVVAGPSALVETILAFVERRDLDFADQVTVIATPPAHRQLAALATAVLNATKSARVLTAQRAFSAPRGALVLVSNDADPADAAKAAKAERA